MIRKCSTEDVEWILGLGRERYGDFIQNIEGTRQWLHQSVNNEKMLMLRSDDAVIICNCATAPFNSTPIASAYAFFGKLWSLIPLFREAKIWAKSKGAEKLHFRSSTEYDIAPLAKRLRADVEYPAYSMRL